jgi:DNA-binding XRE family transcriptional regulator
MALSDWEKREKKNLQPRFKAALDAYEKGYPARLINLRTAVDPHNVNFNSPLTTTVISELIDTVRQNYYKIEKGQIGGGVNCSVQQAIKLCELFGCSIDYLLLGREPKSSNAEILRAQEALETERKMRKILEEENEKLREQVEKLKGKMKK